MTVPLLQLTMRRLAARLVDGFTLFFVMFGLSVSVLFVVMGPLTRLLDVEPWGTRLAPTLVFVLIAVGYETFFVSRRGQTPGRDLLNLKVVGDAGTAPSPWRSFAHSLCWAVVLVPEWRIVAGLVVASVLWLLIDPTGRGPQNRLTGTWVIRYDADVEEGPVVASKKGEDLEDIYGPRSLRSFIGIPRR